MYAIRVCSIYGKFFDRSQSKFILSLWQTSNTGKDPVEILILRHNPSNYIKFHYVLSYLGVGKSNTKF